jgi:methyltransferase-like protein/protein-L-isoaspartate O-methyltransferase
MTLRQLIATPVSYDRMPYPSLSYSQTHPDRLATIATLLDLSPASVECCRVLELGCAGGGNILPMAYALPGSEFVGIDLSGRQIAEGQAVVEALGLENIELQHLDILDVDAGWGQFDYIIAHGIYTWVPELVRDKVLQICRENLAPSGIAYVSYNAYPGWHMINIVRDMMLYHTRSIEEPEEKVSRARAFFQQLAQIGPGEDSAYGSFLRSYAQLLEGQLEDTMPKGDSLLLHDELEADNEPVYFYQFAERAARFGLQYLAEADFADVVRSNVPHEVKKSVDEISSSLIDMEQYMDFVQNRTFRKSLLVHQEVALTRQVQPQSVMGLYAASRARPDAPDPDIHSVSVEGFKGKDGALLSIDHPLSKAAMLCLADTWPTTLSFDELLAAAWARLEPGVVEGQSSEGGRDALVLAANLLRAYAYSDSLVELHAYAPAFSRTAGERPLASAVASYQAQGGGPITNLRHERVPLQGFERYLLRHLDGSRTRADLVDLLLTGPVADGTLTIKQTDGKAGQSPDIGDLLAEEVDKRLDVLASAALLVG